MAQLLGMGDDVTLHNLTHILSSSPRDALRLASVSFWDSATMETISSSTDGDPSKPNRHALVPARACASCFDSPDLVNIVYRRPSLIPK
jgi:hypothetical protein